MLQEQFLASDEEDASRDEMAYPASVPNQRYYGSTQPHAADPGPKPSRIYLSRPQSSHQRNVRPSPAAASGEAQTRKSRKSLRKGSAVEDYPGKQVSLGTSGLGVPVLPQAEPEGAE